MAEIVIDLLEAIEIQEKHRERIAEAFVAETALSKSSDRGHGCRLPSEGRGGHMLDAQSAFAACGDVNGQRLDSP